MSIFKLPDLGEGLPDAEVIKWHVKVGDTVKTDDLLVSMETAKAIVDVPSPQDGVIKKIYGDPGDIIETGAPLVEFESEHAVEDNKHSSTVVGSIPSLDMVLEESAMGVGSSKTNSAMKVKAIPAIRALAKKLGVDLATVNATGPNGTITQEDVKKAATAKTTPSSEVTTIKGAHVEPLRGVRRAMANAMKKSHAEVVPVTLSDDADIHAWPKETDITYRTIRALVAGCKAEPALNAHFDQKNLARHLFEQINIGIAMDSGNGLFVPVLKDAANLNQSKIREMINRFKAEVKARSIAPEELKESTIQLSNFGTFAGRYANPVIVPPIVAIIGTGKIREEVVVANGEIVIHRILPLSITIDHRAITGGEAARFLAAVIADLKSPD